MSNTLKIRTKKEHEMANKLIVIWGSLAPASASKLIDCYRTVN